VEGDGERPLHLRGLEHTKPTGSSIETRAYGPAYPLVARPPRPVVALAEAARAIPLIEAYIPSGPEAIKEGGGRAFRKVEGSVHRAHPIQTRRLQSRRSFARDGPVSEFSQGLTSQAPVR
jgi:hypothetical protein